MHTVRLQERHVTRPFTAFIFPSACVFGLLGSYERAVEVYEGLRRKDSDFRPSETDLNDWAYRMLNGGGKKREALEIFKLNVLLYPDSANVYDSVAEAFEANGEVELAVKNYRRSLALDPNNKNAARQLKRLDPDYR